MATMTYTEEELVHFIKQDCRKAFNYLYQNYSPALYSVISRVVKDAHQVEDVLQETFINIWTNIEQYDAKKGRFYTWIINIARHKAIDSTRSSVHIMRGKTSSEEITETHTHSEQPSTSHIGIAQLVNKLPEKYSTIINNIYYKGFTMPETADALEIPLGTIKTRLRHALRSLNYDFAV